MFNSWFHIRSITRFLANHLPGSTIGACCTFQKNELHIGINNCAAIRGLQCCFHNPLPFLRITADFSEPRHKVSLFKSMTGLIIAQVRWHKNDRQILIQFKDNRGCLLIQLYGINGNLFFVDNNLTLLDSFTKVRKSPTPILDDFSNSDTLTVEPDFCLNALNNHPDSTITRIFPKLPIPIYSKTIIREIFLQIQIPERTLVVNLGERQRELLIDTYQKILAEIDRDRFFIYSNESPLFSMVKLQHSNIENFTTFESVQEASNQFIALFYQKNTLAQTRREIYNRLTTSMQALQRKLEKQKRDLAQLPTAAEYRELADTIMANLNRIEQHQSSVELPKLKNPNSTIRIPLNPKLSTAENAGRYYKKSRQIDQSKMDLQSSIEQTNATIQRISGYLTTLEKCSDLKEIRRIQKTIPAHWIENRIPAESEERKPYHRFIIKDHQFLVGKSARDNDLLSFKHARPEDFWFHVEHGPGSHVIVRNRQKQAALPGNILEIAAGIAAFYSKAKHSALVPVIYTRRKYIWKRKNMPPGKIFTKFTKSVIVKPLDPRSS